MAIEDQRDAAARRRSVSGTAEDPEIGYMVIGKVYSMPTSSIAARLDMVAENLRLGLRETPQRFIPLAWACFARPGASDALVRFLVNDVTVEAADDASCPPAVRDLLGRFWTANERTDADRTPSIVALGPEILAAVPRRRRRRNIHSHGQIASDRRLLFLRAMLDHQVGREGRPSGGVFELVYGTAYAVSEYATDHFEMRGPAVEARVRRLSRFVATLRANSAYIDIE